MRASEGKGEQKESAGKPKKVALVDIDGTLLIKHKPPIEGEPDIILPNITLIDQLKAGGYDEIYLFTQRGNLLQTTNIMDHKDSKYSATQSLLDFLEQKGLTGVKVSSSLDGLLKQKPGEYYRSKMVQHEKNVLEYAKLRSQKEKYEFEQEEKDKLTETQLLRCDELNALIIQAQRVEEDDVRRMQNKDIYDKTRGPLGTFHPVGKVKQYQHLTASISKESKTDNISFTFFDDSVQNIEEILTSQDIAQNVKPRCLWVDKNTGIIHEPEKAAFQYQICGFRADMNIPGGIKFEHKSEIGNTLRALSNMLFKMGDSIPPDLQPPLAELLKQIRLNIPVPKDDKEARQALEAAFDKFFVWSAVSSDDLQDLRSKVSACRGAFKLGKTPSEDKILSEILNAALAELKAAAAEDKKGSPDSNPLHSSARKLHFEITAAYARGEIPVEDMPRITELVQAATACVSAPGDVGKADEYARAEQAVARSPLGQKTRWNKGEVAAAIVGFGCVVLGAVLVGASIAAAILTAGFSTPLTILGIKVGWGLIATGLVAGGVIATAGVAVSVTAEPSSRVLEPLIKSTREFYNQARAEVKKPKKEDKESDDTPPRPHH